MESIKKYLPEHLRKLAATFSIEEKFINNNTELIQLVLESKSIAENSEKQYWFNLLPVMSDTQITKLQDILTREKNKLVEIEQKYQKKQQEIQKRYQETFASPNYQHQQQVLQQKEQDNRETEMFHAENLLNQL